MAVRASRNFDMDNLSEDSESDSEYEPSFGTYTFNFGENYRWLVMVNISDWADCQNGIPFIWDPSIQSLQI